MGMLNSPFIIPLGAFAVAIVAIICGAIGKAHTERTRAEQRIALLAQGVPLAEVERLIGTAERDEAQALPRSPWNPTRAAGVMRRAGLILISSGLGIAAFFIALAPIVHNSQVYSGAAVGLIPILIGVGFFVDYRMQIRDIKHYRDELSR